MDTGLFDDSSPNNVLYILVSKGFMFKELVSKSKVIVNTTFLFHFKF